MPIAPLRSGTDPSDPGFIRSAHAERARIVASAGPCGRVHALPGDAGLLVRTRYPAFEGPIANGPHLRIGLSTGPAARLVQQAGAARLEGVWRPGTLTVTPPGCAGFAASEAVAMIGLAILPGAVEFDADRLHALAGSFHDDPLLASVLVALHHEADTHGAATAFFDHGVALVLHRLGELHGETPVGRSVRPLPQARYDRLLAYAEARLAYDLPVAAMAAVAGMDPSGFTRALRARTGLPPYAWLTQLRMERAIGLLARGLSVTQVAGKVGYANAGKFAAAFRKVHGVPPSKVSSG